MMRRVGFSESDTDTAYKPPPTGIRLDPRWPQSTRAISELRLSFRVAPYGLFAGLSGPRTLHVDIVDYPGEWLLDLALIGKSYADWSEATLNRIAKRPEAADFMARARAEYDEKAMIAAYRAVYGQAMRRASFP